MVRGKYELVFMRRVLLNKKRFKSGRQTASITVGTEIYLRIRAAARNDYIYRIISVQRLFELFENKNNVLVAPAKWDDPFENFILRSQRVYGQCWTLQRASDAMWRIYSPNADAVRVRSTAGTVAQSLRFALNDKLQGDVYIGRVRYVPNEQLMSFAKRVRELSNQRPSKITAETLLVKRPALRHEREFAWSLSRKPRTPLAMKPSLILWIHTN